LFKRLKIKIMAIPPKQIGWSQKSNLLWDISRELDRTLNAMRIQGIPTTTTTTTICFNCVESPVVIGTQTWDKCNLDVTTYANGDPIPEVTDQAIWNTLTTGAWCYYNNDPANGAIYGKMYNWYAVNDIRGLAPAGKHIPSDAEWTVLENHLNSLGQYPGGQMKEIGLCHWADPNFFATNESGFTAFGGGYCGGGFFGLKTIGIWWSSTSLDLNFSLSINLGYSSGNINQFQKTLIKTQGVSVRCLAD
jgi:uncharacterized protein (TIGR02145 family)